MRVRYVLLHLCNKCCCLLEGNTNDRQGIRLVDSIVGVRSKDDSLEGSLGVAKLRRLERGVEDLEWV